MIAQPHAKFPGLPAQKALRQNMDRVFHRIGRNHQAIVAAGVGGRKPALQHDGDGEFLDGMAASPAGDFHHADTGFAIRIAQKFHIVYQVSSHDPNPPYHCPIK